MEKITISGAAEVEKHKQTKKIFELECVHCGEIVERLIPVAKPCCFGCKKKRCNKSGADARKKKKAL